MIVLGVLVWEGTTLLLVQVSSGIRGSHVSWFKCPYRHTNLCSVPKPRYSICKLCSPLNFKQLVNILGKYWSWVSVFLVDRDNNKF